MPKHTVDFGLLIKANKYDYRNDAKLNYMVEKAFIEGLEEGRTREQATEIRKNAYCLVFGIPPSELKNTWVIDYDLLSSKSKKRALLHDEDPKACPCTVDQKCKEMCETIKQIKLDIKRTSVIFDEDG